MFYRGGRPCKQKVNVKGNIRKPLCSKKKEPKSQKDKKETKIISLECTECQIQFKTQKELSKHKKGRHKKTWICEVVQYFHPKFFKLLYTIFIRILAGEKEDGSRPGGT